MNNEELNLKTKTKLQELKNQRSGQTQQINVNIANEPAVNFQCFYNEILQLANMHKINPDELYLMGAHLQLASIKVNVSAINNVQHLTPEEKEELKREQEIAEGKIRVKPEEVQVEVPAVEPVVTPTQETK